MISNEKWEKVICEMFDEAYQEYVKTDSHKKFCKRYNEMLEDLIDKYDNKLANKMNAYLFEFDGFARNRARDLYILGMKDVVSLLKKLDVIS